MSIQIIKGIQLPAFDVELLNSGQLIVVPFKQYSHEGEVFWLYPSQHLPFNLELEQYYQPEYLINARESIVRYIRYPIHIHSWARCEHHWHINLEQKHLLHQIAQSTVWNLSALEHIFEPYQVLKLLILRVYHLSNPCIVNIRTAPGKFYWPKAEDLITTASESDIAVVSDASFNQRKALLLNGKIYPNTGLEAFLFQCEQISYKNSYAQQLTYDIQVFLGWIDNKPAKQIDPDVTWIEKIADIGNSSDGHTFEKLVRKSLLKLGFTGSGLAPESTGGAGGMDFYCEYPYPIVGECKATKSEKVPDGTPAQLLKIGMNHLGKVQYERAIKLIVAAGELNFYALRTATENEMNVIKPETLQKLVELQAHYRGSINLLDLKKCLQQAPYGLADDKVNNYINKINQDIKLRSHLVELVKTYLENTGLDNAGVETLYGVYFSSKPPQPLKMEEMHEILIELSSPLTGYLGRIKGNDWKSDRFYFLRDLAIMPAT
ncbi:MAG: DUF1802 family protein [Nostochopsis sp.]